MTSGGGRIKITCGSRVRYKFKNGSQSSATSGSRKRLGSDLNAAVRPPVDSWARSVAGAEHPPWPQHFVDLFGPLLLNLKHKFGENIRLVMWSDNVGPCIEMYAAQLLAAALQARLGIAIEFMLYAACGVTPQCKDFVLNNYDPPHYTDDFFARNFDESSFKCVNCDGWCPMPKGCCDLYVCSFTWSTLGDWRKLVLHGVEHAEGAHLWQTIRTIKHMRPVMFILENVIDIPENKIYGVNNHDPSNYIHPADLCQIEEFMEDQVGDIYHSIAIRHLSPIQGGYPTQTKLKIAVIGGRKDQVHGGQLSNIFAKMFANPVPLTHTYMTFLGLASISDEIADSIGTRPGPRLASRIRGSGCMCSIDPYLPCAKHPCICPECMKEVDGVVDLTNCRWRRQAAKFLSQNGLQNRVSDGCVTYMQALELIGNRQGPQGPRERHMLNVFAVHPCVDPLRATMSIMDISQPITRCRQRLDGTVPRMGMLSKMWSMQAGRLLTVSELAKLMGVDLGACNLVSITEERMRKMLGQSDHVATSGHLMIGLLAAVCSGDMAAYGSRVWPH